MNDLNVIVLLTDILMNILQVQDKEGMYKRPFKTIIISCSDMIQVVKN